MSKKVWELKPSGDGHYRKTIQLSPEEGERLNTVLHRMQARSSARAASLNQALKELLGVASFGLVMGDDRQILLPPESEHRGLAGTDVDDLKNGTGDE